MDAGIVASACCFDDGFHRVDWEVVRRWIESELEPSDWEGAWNEAALLWVAKLRQDLGGSYSVFQSSQTILLCDQPTATARWLLNYAGHAAHTIKEHLGQTAWCDSSGKDVVIIFSEQDDYYQYLAYHLGEGEHPASGGVCLHSGYTHIAVPWRDQLDAANAIIHELVHDCLAHLSLPLWLNEGVAVTLEKTIGAPARALGQSEQNALFGGSIDCRPPMMWDELAERHFAFWNEENIQTFWAGTSFHLPGESNELSYSLAEVFLKLLTEQTSREAFQAFLNSVRKDDGGQSAALDVLDQDLGAIAGTFLGEGSWRPQRMAMQSAWETTGWKRSASTNENAS